MAAGAVAFVDVIVYVFDVYGDVVSTSAVPLKPVCVIAGNVASSTPDEASVAAFETVNVTSLPDAGCEK